MLDRQKGNIIWQCDECNETLDTNTSDFEAARNLLKRERWVAEKDGDIWEHFCPDCQ